MKNTSSKKGKQRQKKQSKRELKNRNLKTRNFGVRVRKATHAVAILIKNFVKGFNSSKKQLDAFNMFDAFMKQHFASKPISDLRRFKRKHVLKYAEYLRKKIAAGLIKSATAHNYLSALNSVFKLIRQDQKLRVTPVKDANFPKRDYVRKINRATSYIDKSWPLILVVICRLCRDLGLRFEEAVKLNPRVALKQGVEVGLVDIVYGCKGGRPRCIPVTNQEQIATLELASKLQCDNHFSLIPPSMSYVKFQGDVYRLASEFDIQFHDYRHHYIHTRIEAEFGFPARVLLNIDSKKKYFLHIAEQEQQAVDIVRFNYKKAALKVSEEAGHSRDNILTNYGA